MTDDFSADSGLPHSVSYKGEEIAVPDAFWDAQRGSPNLGALLKSHADLRRKLSEDRPGTPETYELAVPETLAGRIAPDPEAPLARDAMAWAKENGIGQQAFSELAALFYGDLAGREPDRESEMATLAREFGPRAEAELDGLSRWATGLLGPVFAERPELQAAAENLASTAAGVMLIKAIKERLGERGLPSARGGAASGLNEADLRALQAGDAYLAGDPATLRKVEEGWKRLYPGAASR